MTPDTPIQGPELSRRQLLKKAGWAVPVIMGLTIPRDALAHYRPGDRPPPQPRAGASQGLPTAASSQSPGQGAPQTGR